MLAGLKTDSRNSSRTLKQKRPPEGGLSAAKRAITPPTITQPPQGFILGGSAVLCGVKRCVPSKKPNKRCSNDTKTGFHWSLLSHATGPMRPLLLEEVCSSDGGRWHQARRAQ